jgi:hypothetical protein
MNAILKQWYKKNNVKFYDHALNQGNLAQAVAMTRARQSSIADGTAWKVVFQKAVLADHLYWEGCRYDVLALAKSLIVNRYHSIFIELPNGKVLTREQIKEAQY